MLRSCNALLRSVLATGQTNNSSHLICQFSTLLRQDFRRLEVFMASCSPFALPATFSAGIALPVLSYRGRETCLQREAISLSRELRQSKKAALIGKRCSWKSVHLNQSKHQHRCVQHNCGLFWTLLVKFSLQSSQLLKPTDLHCNIFLPGSANSERLKRNHCVRAGQAPQPRCGICLHSPLRRRNRSAHLEHLQDTSLRSPSLSSSLQTSDRLCCSGSLETTLVPREGEENPNADSNPTA